MLNCPNCGYPFDPKKDRCEYCGTSCYDICGLTLDAKPFNLRFKAGNSSFISKAYVNSFCLKQEPLMMSNCGDPFVRVVNSFSTLSLDITLVSDPILCKEKTYGS